MSDEHKFLRSGLSSSIKSKLMCVSAYEVVVIIRIRNRSSSFGCKANRLIARCLRMMNVLKGRIAMRNLLGQIGESSGLSSLTSSSSSISGSRDLRIVSHNCQRRPYGRETKSTCEKSSKPEQKMATRSCVCDSTHHLGIHGDKKSFK